MVEHPEACPAWRDDLTDWVMAQIAPDREAGLRAHFATCVTCRVEAEGLLDVAAITLALEPGRHEPPSVDDHPSADLAGRIAARVAAERRRRTVRRALLAAAGGAAAAVVLVGAIALGGGDGGEPLRGQAFVFTVRPDGVDASTVVAADGAGGSVVEIVASGLSPDVTYALWLSAPGGRWDERVPAGTFRADEDGRVDTRLRSALPAGAAGRVWATTPEGTIALDTE